MAFPWSKLSRRSANVVLAAVSVTLAGSLVLASQGAVLAPCTSSQLTGSFNVIPGSAGAGNVVYRLRLANLTSRTCFVSGVPALTLLDANGRKLPTNGQFSGPRGSLTAVIVPLAKGHVASLSARFSPDVPGTGEQTTGPCEKSAHKLRVVTGHADVVVPVTPPTAVCEHGSLQLGVFTAS